MGDNRTSTPETDPELTAFAERVHALIVEFADRRKINAATMAGALIGAGIELGLRNGITAPELHTHFRLTVQMIEKMLTGGTSDA